MKSINLTKYGFVRSPEDDFSDDGSRFTCYRVGDVRVSKCVSGDEIFIAGRYEGPTLLRYEEYSGLPHYKAMDDLNGVDKSDITEEDLVRFYQDCVAYDREYKQALSEVVYPTVDEIAEAKKAKADACRAELADIKSKISDNLDKVFGLDDYHLRQLRDYYNRIARDASSEEIYEQYALDIVGTLFSRNFVSADTKPSYCYESALELLEKAGVR